MRHRSFPLLARLSVALAVCGVLVVSAPALARALDTSTRPASAIQQRWSELKPSYTGSPYAVAPRTSAPYAAGSLDAAFLQDGLDTINYARFLAGLPDDVVLDAAYVDRAQHGAVLLAAGTFAHTQPKPADMDQAFYDLGYGATKSSNIGSGYSTLAQFNSDCLHDSDISNIGLLGHRRWLLDPPLKKTGMGYAAPCSDTFVFDQSRTGTVDYDSVKWPCAGYFPVEMFGTATAWSITLNPAKYSWTAGRAGHTVTLRRTRDGRTWTFTRADTSTSGKYFNFETSGFGVANCFIFRPDAATLGSYQVGDVFDVTLSGGITLKSTGAPAKVSYQTKFMSHDAPPAPDVTAPVTTSITIGAVPASVYLPKTFVLSGVLTPGLFHDPCGVEVKKPGSGRWSYSSARLAYATTQAGGAAWWYRYTPKLRGLYYFRVRFAGDAVRAASLSRTLSVRVR